MQIEIKPAEIDQYVKDAIMKSTVGQSLAVHIEKEIKEMMNNYRNPIKQFMQDILKTYVEDYMKQPEIKSKLIEAIATVIKPETIEIIVRHGIFELQKAIRNKDD